MRPPSIRVTGPHLSIKKQLKEDEPDLKFGEVGKRLGEIWNTLPNGDKEVPPKPSLVNSH